MNHEQEPAERAAVPRARDRAWRDSGLHDRVECALNDDLRKEWEEYLEQTTRHEQIMTDVLTKLGLDPETETSGRAVVRSIGESLVNAMQMALASGPAEAAELVAGECVVQAETKDHLNWELMELAADNADKKTAEICGQRSKRSKRKKTSTCTTRPDGPVSCGCNRSGSRPCFRHRRSRRTSPPPSGPHAPRTPATKWPANEQQPANVPRSDTRSLSRYPTPPRNRSRSPRRADRRLEAGSHWRRSQAMSHVMNVTQCQPRLRRCTSVPSTGVHWRTPRRINMNVMAIARSIGLVTDDRREVSGTIEESVVLASISELAAADPGNDDLFADAAMRVQLARSAGVELPTRPAPCSVPTMAHRCNCAIAPRWQTCSWTWPSTSASATSSPWPRPAPPRRIFRKTAPTLGSGSLRDVAIERSASAPASVRRPGMRRSQ